HTRLQGDWSSDVCSSDLSRRSGAPPRSLAEALDLSITGAARPSGGFAERGEDLERICASAGWDIDTAARLLQIGRATLYRRLRKIGRASCRESGEGGEVQ